MHVSPNVTTTYELEVKSPNGCIGYDVVTVTVNSGTQCQPTCGTPDYNNQTLTANTVINNTEVVISSTLRVPNNITLKIIDSKVNLMQNAKIEIMPGGKLEIVNSQLRACDITKPWTGISVRGNNNVSSQLNISGSTLTDALTPISMDKVTGANITANIFANGTTAITMDKCKNFTIAKNQFYSYDVGISAGNSVLDVRSIISQNYFYQVKTTVLLENGNFTKLDIQCNIFDSYTDYAIYSNNSSLQDQGSVGEGAGNMFISNSTQINDKLRHNGNVMKYYYNPSSPVSLITGTGMNATAQAAIFDGSCVDVGNFKENEQDEIETSGIENSNSNLLNCIPNPASSKATFIYFLPEKTSSAEIRITNILGELVAKYQVTPGSSSIEVDCSGFKNGIYFYSLISDNNLVSTKKMMITK